MLASMRARLRDRGAGPPSWRELAAAAGVSLSTLTHHFGRREDVVRAVLEDEFRLGAEALALMERPAGSFAESAREAIGHLAGGMIHDGLDMMIASGLAEGLGHPVIGPAFIANHLEPMLQAIERRLDHHVATGEMRTGNTRVAAIELTAPIIVGLLHQRTMGGASIRPLGLDEFLAAHVDAFVRAWKA